MALESNCLRITRVGRATPHWVSTFSSREKLLFPTYRRFNKYMLNLTASNPSLYSTGGSCRKSRIICNAREAVNEVTDSSWNNLVIASETPVLVEFWAPWCGPCRMIAPAIDELAKEYAGKIACYKPNTDDCPNIARVRNQKHANCSVLQELRGKKMHSWCSCQDHFHRNSG